MTIMYSILKNITFMYLSKNKKDKDNCPDLDKVTITSSPKVTLLGIIIDNKLTFNEHLKMICKKTSPKLNALTRLCNIISFPQKKLAIQFLHQISS